MSTEQKGHTTRLENEPIQVSKQVQRLLSDLFDTTRDLDLTGTTVQGLIEKE